MKNKENLKRLLKYTIIILLVNYIVLFIYNKYTYNQYKKNYNDKLNSIIFILKDKYPNISDDEIIKVLQNNKKYDNITSNYGYSNKDDLLNKNNKLYNNSNIFILIFILLNSLIFLILILAYEHKKTKQIDSILELMEKINNKDYSFNIDEISEDELSRLKNEIYKITIMLKENALKSSNEKKELKKSLEDISHQLKTPLTSILIMLDNITDNQDMDKNIEEEFIKDIKREIININFLVQEVLKLSKFDSNTVNYVKTNNNLKDIIDKSISNISTLCDLKNIKVNVECKKNITINCDFMWQVEALTNIIKNSVEHSFNDNKIDIKCSQNKIYTKVSIRDYGEGINSKDLPHLFERFYKGENSSFDSIGIGLALAKTIIEKNNGSIKVNSFSDGLEFVIKYFDI